MKPGRAMCPLCAEPTVVVEAIVHGRAGFLIYDADQQRQHRLSCSREMENEPKVCTGCHKAYPRRDFYWKSGAGDRRTARCKECVKKAVAEYKRWKPPTVNVGQPA